MVISGFLILCCHLMLSFCVVILGCHFEFVILCSLFWIVILSCHIGVFVGYFVSSFWIGMLGLSFWIVFLGCHIGRHLRLSSCGSSGESSGDLAPSSRKYLLRP